jgi:glycosyltransferase involved in cell wall biosynthesis
MKKKYKIFVSGMAYDGGKSGISFCIKKVVKYLSKDNYVELLLLKQDAERFPVKNDNLKIISVSNLLAKPVVNMLWHLFILPFTRNYKKYDFIVLPAGNRRLFCCYPRYTIVIFHDLSQFHIDQKYDRFRMFYIKRIIPLFLKKADSIMAISYSTKKDLEKYYNLKDVWVNHNGYEKPVVSEAKGKKVADVNGKFLFYLARVEHPGKNHLNLIKAYEKLPDDVKQEYILVFAGKVWEGSEPVMNYVANSADKARIKFMGFVEEDELNWLYKNCSLYIFPSFFEGFGLPILDAMNYGVPVICSNTSSLPEVGGKAVLTFDPNNVQQIKDRIIEVLKDNSLQESMIKAGFEQVEKFDWAKHVQKIKKDYEKNA